MRQSNFGLRILFYAVSSLEKKWYNFQAMNKYRIILIYIVVIAAFVGIGFWLFKSSENIEQNQPGQALENQGQEHITQGSLDHPPYDSNPPTSGWHWPQPANWGAYDTTLPDEQLIHNLEHGGIWISYHPEKVDADTISRLKDFSQRYPLIIVEPRPSNPSPIMLAAWQHLQALEQYDERTILEFIDAYHNKGPEKVI